MSIEITEAVKKAHAEHCTDPYLGINIAIEPLQAYVNAYGIADKDIDAITCDDAKEAYLGKHDSMVAYAKDTIEQCYNVPKGLEKYIDYDKFAKQLIHDGYWIDNGHVFFDNRPWVSHR